MVRKCRGLFVVFMSISGATSLAGTVESGALQWSVRLPIVNSSPAIGPDGTIYVGTASDWGTRSEVDSGLYAINPDGSVKWRYQAAVPPFDAELISSPAIGADGTIYAWSAKHYHLLETAVGTLHAITADGQQKWSRTTACQGGYVAAPPAIAADGTIYLGTDAGIFYAFTPDGDIRWQVTLSTIGTEPASAVAVGLDGTIYVGLGISGVVCALDPAGNLKWRFAVPNASHIGLALGADGAICVTSYGSVLALNPDGTVRWQSTEVEQVSSSAAIGGDGTLYVQSGYGNEIALVALNPDGTRKWRFPLGEMGDAWLHDSSPTIAADGTIYIATDSWYSCAVNPDGTCKWQAPTWSVCTAPAIGHDGTVYFGSFGGLIALSGSAPLANTPWPTMAHDSGNSGRATPYGDVDGDGLVDAADLLAMIASWGLSISEVGYNARCDLSADGIVDVSDLLTLMENMDR